MAENKILLEIKDLHASVGDKEILRGINLTIREGETHAIMGPNGQIHPLGGPGRQGQLHSDLRGSHIQRTQSPGAQS